jgi:hypothetical protein
MRAIRMIGVVAAIALASAGAMASSASAKPKNLDLFYYLYFNGEPYEQQVPAGAQFAAGEPTGMKYDASGGGSLSCPGARSALTGEVLTNNTPKDEILLNKETTVAIFGRCSSTVRLGTAADLGFYLGTATAIYLGSNLKGEVVARPGHPHEAAVEFNGGALCYYTAIKLKVSFSLKPVKLTFTKQKLTLEKKDSSASCPKTMSFSAVYSSPTVNTSNPLYARVG